jgi:proteic killer suppression protein
MIYKVFMSKTAFRDLKKVPKHLQEKFRAWVMAVNQTGLEETRKRPGWHDEPLSGKRKGQRSVRLNKQWRVIYIVRNDQIEFVEVKEIMPHEY